MTSRPKRATDWRQRFDRAKPPKTVTLDVDFAGIKAGTVLYIGSPSVFADYVARIPPGHTRTIERMRNELARRHRAGATCPVTTAIFLKVVAELALDELRSGKPADAVAPFWRVVEPGSKIAKGLSCDTALLADLRASDAARAARAASTGSGPFVDDGADP
jgi:hypothetical protein